MAPKIDSKRYEVKICGRGLEKGIAGPAGKNNPWNQLTTNLFQSTPSLVKALQKKDDFYRGRTRA